MCSLYQLLRPDVLVITPVLIHHFVCYDKFCWFLGPFGKMSCSIVACGGFYGCWGLFWLKWQEPNLVRRPGKSLEWGFIDECTQPSLRYGITEALCEDSGARDLSYGPFLECDVLFPSQLHIQSMVRDTGLPNLFPRAVTKIYRTQSGDCHNYECIGSSGH